jgi:hypothetical protein
MTLDITYSLTLLVSCTISVISQKGLTDSQVTSSGKLISSELNLKLFSALFL